VNFSASTATCPHFLSRCRCGNSLLARNLRAISEAHRHETVAGAPWCNSPGAFDTANLNEAAAHDGVWVFNGSSNPLITSNHFRRPGTAAGGPHLV
jgi:hypothetical protein